MTSTWTLAVGLLMFLVSSAPAETGIPVPPDHWNRPAGPWPEAAERGVEQRARLVIERTKRERYGNTFFENEKRAYGWAMLSLLGGLEEPALKFLQEEDNQAETWHRHTRGIDFFAAFTLKHQVRKYFYFGDRLDPGYRERMKEGAAVFTSKDPLRRPHHAFDPDGDGVWGPDGKNSWVDVRSTDNLRLMRETSVYLFAEETGNEATRLLYKDRLVEYVSLLYHAGMGEWDSENYLGHSIAPLLNLYDFARDEEVRRLAKAGLDWMCISGALKYRRGNFAGPTKRDYNHPYPYGGSAAGCLWYWFGGIEERHEFESDEIQQITSGYRPPNVCLALAKKDFDGPVELLRNHPQWAPWEVPREELRPEYRETHYFGERFQFGTLLKGTRDPDVNGFTILSDHPDRGAETILAAPCSDPLKLGSPVYVEGLLGTPSWVAQNANLAIYLAKAGDHPWLFLVPAEAEVSERSGVTLVETASLTMAIWPIHLDGPRGDRELTETVQFREKKGERMPRWPHSQVLSAGGTGEAFSGFAIEIAEGKEARKRLAEQAPRHRPELEELDLRGALAFSGVGGKRLRLQTGDTLEATKIWRDGKLRDWSDPEEGASFRVRSGDLEIRQDWGSGQLSVEVGGVSYRCRVGPGGQVSWD